MANVLKNLRGRLTRKEAPVAKESDAGTTSPTAALEAKFSELTSLVGKLADSLKAVADGQAEITKIVSKPAAAATADKAAEAAKPLTQESVAELIRKGVTEALSAAKGAEAKIAAVAKYATEKMKDLPEVYRKLLPQTDDAAQLAAAEQTIRTQYKSDLSASGAVPKDVGGAADLAGGAAPLAVVDYSKLSPMEKIVAGLKQSKPMRVATPEALIATSRPTAPLALET
jgi:hypothetical protein